MHTQLLSANGYITPSSNHLIISFFTTSYIGGFKRLWCAILGLSLGMSWILCEQNPGRDPNNICNSPPNSSFEPFNTSTKLSTWCILKSDAIITGKVSPFPKNTYLRWGGRGLSSNFGASSIYDFDGGDSRCFISNINFFVLTEHHLDQVLRPMTHTL